MDLEEAGTRARFVLHDRDASFTHVLKDIRRRQREGELASEFDAEFILIASWATATAMAPIALPHLVRGAYGTDPAAFRADFLPQLQRLFKRQELTCPPA
jgi:hypothetical protein